MTIITNPPQKPAAPTDLDEVTPQSPSNPSDLNEVAPQTPSNPTNLTEQPAQAPANPTNLTEVAPDGVGNPSDLTEVAPQTPANPSNLTEVNPQTPSNPTNLVEQPAQTPSNPTNLTEIAKPNLGAPTDLTERAKMPLLRSLTPKLNLDFGNDIYSTCGSAKALTDIVNYSRPSSATFINRRRSACGSRWEYFLDTDYVGSVTNLVTYSERFDDADWTLSEVSLSANNNKNPITGAKDADLVIPNQGSSVIARQSQSITVTNGVNVTGSCYIKSSGARYIRMLMTNTVDNSNAWFDIISGVVLRSDQGASIEYISDGWYRISITGTTTNTSVTFFPYHIVGGDGFSTLDSDGSQQAILWGAQLTESAKPLPYVKTLSSSATETFTESPRLEYDPITGESLGYLAEGSSSNLLDRSEEFDSASWSKTRASVSANQIIAPDGTKSADLLIPSAVDGTHAINNTGGTISNKESFSVYAKSGGYSWIGLWLGSGIAYFNISEGLIGSIPSGLKASINSVGGGWYRVSISGVRVSSVNNLIYVVENDGDANFIGDGTSGVYIWGAQLEQQQFATSYIRTEGSAVSRSADTMNLGASIIPTTAQSHSWFAEGSIIGSIEQSSGTNQCFFIITDDNFRFLRLVDNNSSAPTTIYGNASTSARGVTDMAPFVTEKFAGVLRALEAYTLYRNGQQEAQAATVALSTGGANGGTDLVIGAANTGGSQPLQGHVKQLRFYDVALTESEIKNL